METATLFGLSAEDWRSFALTIFASAAGYTALYVLGIDTKRLPFVTADHEYRVPAWFLALSAALLCLSFAFCAAVYLTLRFLSTAPDVTTFERQFFRNLTQQERAWLEQLQEEPIVGAHVSLNRYDGLSDVAVMVNNVRVFGTHVDCVTKNQCRSGLDAPTAPRSLNFKIDSRYSDPLNTSNALGTARPLHSLREGENFIDVVVGNSGRGSCWASIELSFKSASGKSISHILDVRDGEKSSIEQFETMADNGAYRICERVRFRARLAFRG